MVGRMLGLMKTIHADDEPTVQLDEGSPFFFFHSSHTGLSTLAFCSREILKSFLRAFFVRTCQNHIIDFLFVCCFFFFGFATYFSQTLTKAFPLHK